MTKQRLVQKQHQTISPLQIEFLGLLQTPITSLEKRIEKELEENPALDEDEEIELDKSTHYNSSTKPNFTEIQIEDKSDSLEDHLTKQLVGFNLEEDMLFLVKYLINSLDNNGYLSQNLYSISSDLLTNNNLEASETKLQCALKILQNLDPIGVGAKNLKHCLLLQLEKNYSSKKIASKIITEFYTPFSNKNFEYLIKNLNISIKKLKAIYQLIESLNPIPSAGYSKNNNSTEYIYADFTVLENNNELELQINKGNKKKIKVSRYYENLLSETTDPKTREFLIKKVDKAKWFKESLERRDNTLKKVMKAIIMIQKEFLISGFENTLKPMKLSDIAENVNMDISTISRVSNSKFIETHFGTFKVKELFSEAYRKDNGELISTNEIKNKLKKIISSEDKLRPFTDEKLAEILGEKEYHIARRTVAKYRDILGIETSILRRTL